MRRVITFRATDFQVSILEMAEKIIQKPRGEILALMIEKNLQQTLREMVVAGARPKDFTPPPQRLCQRKKAKNASDDSS